MSAKKFAKKTAKKSTPRKRGKVPLPDPKPHVVESAFPCDQEQAESTSAFDQGFNHGRETHPLQSANDELTSINNRLESLSNSIQMVEMDLNDLRRDHDRLQFRRSLILNKVREEYPALTPPLRASSTF